jgi:hypothetical protein
MSKTLQRLDHLQENRLEKPGTDTDPVKETAFPKWGVVLWLTASIMATVFSYQLGLRQGMQTVQDESPRQWLYYFNESFEKTAPSEVQVPAAAATAAFVPTAVEVKKSAPPETPESRESGFTIQVVTYRSKSLAQKEVERLEKKGHEAFVVPAGDYFQVCIDLYKDRKLAMKKLIQLRTEKYYETYPGAFVKFLKQQG